MPGTEQLARNVELTEKFSYFSICFATVAKLSLSGGCIGVGTLLAVQPIPTLVTNGEESTHLYSST